jgi:hypothetical protein
MQLLALLMLKQAGGAKNASHPHTGIQETLWVVIAL